MKRYLPWGIVTVLFLVVALYAATLAFQPVTLHRSVEFNGERIVTTTDANPLNKGLLLSESWKEYPKYNIGLGVIAFFSGAGALFSAKNLTNLEKRATESQF